MDIYKRFNDFTKLATDTYLEATEVFYPPHFDSTPNIGDADESKIGAIATYKAGSTTNLAIYQGGGVWREGTGYTDAEIDAMITAAKNRANHTGTQPINTIEGLEAALDSKISTSEKGASNGVATLDINSKIPLSQVPDALIGSVNYQGNWNPATNTPTLPATPASSTKGHYYIASTTGTFNGIEYNNGDWIISNGAVWGKVDNTNKVVSVNGKQGAVVLTLSDIAGTTDLVTLNTAQTITAKKTFQTPDATTGNAVTPIEVKGGNGADNAGTSGVASAGNGGDLKITTGNGGTSAGVNPSGTNIGGKGGQINITAGNGGIATAGGTNIPGNGGNVVVQAGTAFTTGVSGRVEIKAGNNDDGKGGDIYLTTGYGSGGPDSDVNAGNIYMAMSASNNIRGSVIIGANSTQNNGNRLQVFGKASVSQAPTAPTDVVRLSDLSTKANSDGSNASGTWPIAITGNAVTWGGQQYSSDEVPINNYILAYGTDGKWHPSNKERVNAFLGAPSAGETLQSVTDRGSVTDESITTSEYKLIYSDGNSYQGIRRGSNGVSTDLYNNVTSSLSASIFTFTGYDGATDKIVASLNNNGVFFVSGGNSTQWNTAFTDRVDLGTNQTVDGNKTFVNYLRSNQGFTAYASVNSQASYRPTGITFNPAANTYATIDANTSGGLTIRTADGSATAQIRMTFLTPNGATARSVMFSGRAYYGSDYSGSFEANDLIPKKYVDDKTQLITLRATISAGVAVLDGGAVESGYRYMVQGASLYNGTTPEFLSLSKLAIQAGTTGNVVAQYETTSVDNGKDVEVLILKIKI